MKTLLLIIACLFMTTLVNAKTDSTQTNFVDSLKNDASTRGGVIYKYEFVTHQGINYHTFRGWKCYLGGTMVLYDEQGHLLYHVNAYNYFNPQPIKAIEALAKIKARPYVSLDYMNWFFIDAIDYPLSEEQSN